MKIINLDMDGLLVDFDEEFRRRHGMTPHEYRGQANTSFWEKFNENPHEFYLNAPPFDGYLAFVETVEEYAEKYGYTVHVLTALPRMSTYPTAREEKMEWLVANGLGHLPVKFGPHSVDKQKHCEPGDILIDDNSKNIRQWQSKGGYGIFHVCKDGMPEYRFAQSLAHLRHILRQEKVLATDPGF